MSGVIYELQDVGPGAGAEESADKLVELVVPSTSLDCPHTSIQVMAVFTQRTCSRGVSQMGRDIGDVWTILFSWTKFTNARLCKFSTPVRYTLILALSRYIESQVLLHCKDLISTCVVVGSGKPSPTLIVEPFEQGTCDIFSFWNELDRKVEPINKDGFPHEPIHTSHIFIVPPGALPHTPVSHVYISWRNHYHYINPPVLEGKHNPEKR